MVEFASYLIVILLLGLSIFQIFLILGFPIGKFAWGGYHNILPTKLRVGSFISIFLYLLFGIIALDRSGISLLINNDSFTNAATWFLVAYFALGIFMNGISRSKSERNMMTPISLLLFLCYLVLALS